jgi:sugar lactone lactonase YvrE
MSRIPASAYGFVSDFEGGSSGSGTVYVINGSAQVIAQLSGTTFPQGMAVTNHPAALYVANSGGDNILKYTSLNGSPATLNNGGVEPSDVKVDSNGNVAAMNIQVGTVNCFNGGATSPTKTISGGGFSEVFFGAFDASGNLFVDGFSGSGTVLVGEIVGGCATGTTITALSTSNALEFPGGLEAVGNTLYLDDQEAFTIYGYSLPPSGGSLGSPTSTTTLSGAGDPVTFALTPAANLALVADAGNVDAAVYRFPQGGSALKLITLPQAALPIGTAIYPAPAL